jgi:hypothetical protein
MKAINYDKLIAHLAKLIKKYDEEADRMSGSGLDITSRNLFCRSDELNDLLIALKRKGNRFLIKDKK